MAQSAQRLPVDQARLRPHLRSGARAGRQQADVVPRGEFERADKAGVSTGAAEWKTPTGDDRQRLRGLPCIAREVTGAQPGSDPVIELLRKEARQERRRR